jgi:mRNA-degrading endonuclease YafQ of YafQ-DinJ toxin-antitoxin module
MDVSFSDSFKKTFRKRTKSPVLEKEFWFRLELFIKNPFDPKLKTHKLSGKLKGLWSFYVDYDFRVVFYFTKKKPKKAVFIDIGTHDEVY